VETRKDSEAARKLAVDLTEEKGVIKALNAGIKRCRIRLGRGYPTKNRRKRIERKLRYYQECLYHSTRELEDKTSGFSEAICQIEAVLRQLAETGKTFANVHRFDHTA
jgi:hypothetical protein